MSKCNFISEALVSVQPETGDAYTAKLVTEYGRDADGGLIVVATRYVDTANEVITLNPTDTTSLVSAGAMHECSKGCLITTEQAVCDGTNNLRMVTEYGWDAEGGLIVSTTRYVDSENEVVAAPVDLTYGVCFTAQQPICTPGSLLAANFCVGNIILVPSGDPTDVRTVGTDGDFADLPTALADSEVVDGTILKLVSDQELTATLNVDKAVVIDGAGFKLDSGTTDPVTMFNMTAPLSVVKNAEINHLKTTNTSLETVFNLNSPTGPVFVVNNKVNVQEFAFVVNGQYIVQGNELEYIGASQTNSHRFFYIIGNAGESRIDDNTFGGITVASGTRYTNFSLMRTVGGSTFEGKLYITNNVQVGGSLRQFFLHDSGATNGLELIVANNEFDDLNGGIGIISPALFNSYSKISIFNNVQGDSATGNYKGVFFVDGSGTINPDVVFSHGGNTTTAGDLRVDYTSMVEGSDNLIARRLTTTLEAPFACVGLEEALEATGVLLQELKSRWVYLVDAEGNPVSGTGTAEDPYVVGTGTATLARPDGIVCYEIDRVFYSAQTVNNITTWHDIDNEIVDEPDLTNAILTCCPSCKDAFECVDYYSETHTLAAGDTVISHMLNLDDPNAFIIELWSETDGDFVHPQITDTAPNSLTLTSTVSTTNVRVTIKAAKSCSSGTTTVPIAVSEDGTLVSSELASFNFTGNVAVTDDGAGNVTVDVSAPPAYAADPASAPDGAYEGQLLYITNTGDEFGVVDEVYAWLGGIWSPYPIPPATVIPVSDEGTVIESALASLNFTGNVVVTTNGTGGVTVNVPEPDAYAKLVFVDSLDPGTATVFSESSDLAVNDPSLVENDTYVYAATDGGTWVWNGTAYIQKPVADGTEWYFKNTTIDAGANKTSRIERPGAVDVGTRLTALDGFGMGVRIVNANTTVTDTDTTLVVITPAITVTMSNPVGRQRTIVVVKNWATSSINLTGLLDGTVSRTITIGHKGSIVMQSDGTTWNFIAAYTSEYAVSQNASTGAILEGVPSYFLSDGNYQANLTLPSNAPYIGYELTIINQATLSTTVATTNSNLLAPLSVTSNKAKVFRWAGSTLRWQLVDTEPALDGTPYLLSAYSTVNDALPGGYTLQVCKFNVVDTTNTTGGAAAQFNTTTYRFTPNRAGWYDVRAAYAIWRGSQTTDQYLVLRKNGALQLRNGGYGPLQLSVSKTMFANGTTDYFDVVNQGGAAQTRQQSFEESLFQARWLHA